MSDLTSPFRDLLNTSFRWEIHHEKLLKKIKHVL